MKTTAPSLPASILAVGVLVTLSAVWPSVQSSGQSPGPTQEFVTIHWAGRDNTHLIRPGGRVEFIGPELRKLSRPDRCDERAFYLNAAMNGLAKDGFEVAAVFNDDVVMKRSVRP